MDMKRFKSTTLFSILLLTTANLYSSPLNGADSNIAHDEKTFSVEFVREIFSTSDLLKEKSIGEKIIDWILGDDDINFIRPMGVICNGKKGLVVLDQGGGFLAIIDTIEQKVKLILDEEDRLFPSLVGLCKFDENSFLFTESRQNRIYAYNLKNNSTYLFSKSVDLNQPTGIAYNHSSGEIWVVETLNHQVKIFDKTGNYLRSVGERGTGEGQFNFPTYIWIDKDGIVYIVDSMNFRLQMFDSSGNFIKMFGETGDASGFFARPKGVAVDSYGHIYIVDALFSSVQVFDKDGQFLYYFGSKGNNQGEFMLPTGIYLDSNDFIYVSDSFNSRIQIFRLISNEK